MLTTKVRVVVFQVKPDISVHTFHSKVANQIPLVFEEATGAISPPRRQLQRKRLTLPKPINVVYRVTRVVKRTTKRVCPGFLVA